MSNLIDFEHLQTVLLSVAYARIKTFFLIIRSYFDDEIINVKTPNFLPYVMQVFAVLTLIILSLNYLPAIEKKILILA